MNKYTAQRTTSGMVVVENSTLKSYQCDPPEFLSNKEGQIVEEGIDFGVSVKVENLGTMEYKVVGYAVPVEPKNDKFDIEKAATVISVANQMFGGMEQKEEYTIWGLKQELDKYFLKHIHRTLPDCHYADIEKIVLSHHFHTLESSTCHCQTSTINIIGGKAICSTCNKQIIQ